MKILNSASTVKFTSNESRKRFEEYWARRHGISPGQIKNYRGVIQYAYNASHSLCGPYPENSYRRVENKRSKR